MASKSNSKYGHFPAGKGDAPIKVDKKKYDKNYDQINWKSKKKK